MTQQEERTRYQRLAAQERELKRLNTLLYDDNDADALEVLVKLQDMITIRTLRAAERAYPKR